MSKLSDNQPITYDYLRGLENDIARLSKSIQKLNGKDAQEANISVRGGRGADVSNAKNVAVLIDKINVVETDKAVINGTVTFSGTSFIGPPIVVANIVNSSKRDDEQSPPYAVLTIGNINKSGFDFRIQMVTGAATNKRTLLVNYIAVGKTSS